MEMKFCQSCGMPLTNEVLGTNADGTPNEDFCICCYKHGKFTQNMTMEHMIDHCAQFTDEINRKSYGRTDERADASVFPASQTLEKLNSHVYRNPYIQETA